MREKPHVKPESFQKANPSDWLFELKIIELFESSQSPTTTKNGGITKAFRAYQGFVAQRFEMQSAPN